VLAKKSHIWSVFFKINLSLAGDGQRIDGANAGKLEELLQTLAGTLNSSETLLWTINTAVHEKIDRKN